MAAARAMADRHIVSSILHHLSDMKYKDRRQRGPDQPVEFLEFRPTLVPSILVNKLWAEEGTAILWKRYPHLPALKGMRLNRRQWYADKVERLFVMGPPPESEEDLAYLEGLRWPKLQNLELEADWRMHGKNFKDMLHAGLKRLEFSGLQTGDSKYMAQVVLPALFVPCKNLQCIFLGPDAIDPEDPVHNQVLSELLASASSIKDVRIMNTSFFGKDQLFGQLSQRAGLESLETNLDPGLRLLPLFSGPNAPLSSFASLKRLHIMCYPEIALALPGHLRLIEDLQLEVGRIPNQAFQPSDLSILDDLLYLLSQCPELRSLRVNIGQMAADFPSASAHPMLSGAAMIKLATGCPKLHGLNLLALEPAAIDGSQISSTQLETFCKQSPHLRSLSLKLFPSTTIALEQTALHSLGKHCPMLEVLRLKSALDLLSIAMPSLVSHTDKEDVEPIALEQLDGSRDRTLFTLDGNDCIEHTDSQTPTSSSIKPLFPCLTHLALARPHSILSIANDSYTVSSPLLLSMIADPSLEQDLVRTWAQCLLAHFPRLEILEAWGDWTGQDNESLNYFLPIEETLASTWEFLSGVEQDLWEDGEDEEHSNSDIEDWDTGYEERVSGEDWEKASLMNEFPLQGEIGGGGYLDMYEEELEGTITPGRILDRDDEGFFEQIDGKHT